MKEKILVYGGSGLVGSRFIELCQDKFEIYAPSHELVDLTKFWMIKESISLIHPHQILYCAGFTNVDRAETERGLSYLLNASAPLVIAEEANRLGIPVHYLSTDYIFNGKKDTCSYCEQDGPDPLAVYARNKLKGELNVLQSDPRNSILRIIMPYRSNFPKKLDLAHLTLKKLQNREKIIGVIDQNINPVLVDDVINGISVILQTQSSGIYHLGAADYTTPYDFMRIIANKFGLNEDLIETQKFEIFSRSRPALRPQHSWLDTTKFRREFGDGILHSIEEAITFLRQD